MLWVTSRYSEAGARWPVSDREAAGFVSRVYRWIGAGMTTAEALRKPRAA